MLSGSLAPCCVLLRDASLPSSILLPLSLSAFTNNLRTNPKTFSRFISSVYSSYPRRSSLSLSTFQTTLSAHLLRGLLVHSLSYQRPLSLAQLSPCRWSKPVRGSSFFKVTRIHSLTISSITTSLCVVCAFLHFNSIDCLPRCSARPLKRTCLALSATSLYITSRHLHTSIILHETKGAEVFVDLAPCLPALNYKQRTIIGT